MIISSEKYKVEFFDQPEYVANQSNQIKNILNQFLDFFDIMKLDLEISFCSEDQIRELNKKFRGKDSATNVLSFPTSLENYEVISSLKPTEADNPYELGDIAIAFEICKKEATKSQVKFEHHVYHLIIHSVLHLLGFDHEEEENASKMEKIEVQVLANLGISNPYL